MTVETIYKTMTVPQLSRFRWQNLNTKMGRGLREIPLGSAFFRGRAWLWLFGHSVLNFEWCMLNHSKQASIGFFVLDDENDAGIHLCIPYLFSVYISICLPISCKTKYALLKKVGIEHLDDLVTQISIFDKGIWIDFFEPRWGGWNSKDKWWERRKWSIHPLDIVFGHLKLVSKDLSNSTIKIAMPEKVYEGTCKITHDVWKRPRLWFDSIARIRSHIDIPGGIPVPGKGTMSDNCDEDAIYGMTCCASTEAEAIGAIVKDALETREKYGSRNWKPEEKSKTSFLDKAKIIMEASL